MARRSQTQARDPHTQDRHQEKPERGERMTKSKLREAPLPPPGFGSQRRKTRTAYSDSPQERQMGPTRTNNIGLYTTSTAELGQDLGRTKRCQVQVSKGVSRALNHSGPDQRVAPERWSDPSTLFHRLVVFSLVLVPFVRGLRVVVRASRSADSTSVGLRYLSAIARTRERNCLSLMV